MRLLGSEREASTEGPEDYGAFPGGRIVRITQFFSGGYLIFLRGYLLRAYSPKCGEVVFTEVRMQDPA